MPHTVRHGSRGASVQGASTVLNLVGAWPTAAATAHIIRAQGSAQPQGTGTGSARGQAKLVKAAWAVAKPTDYFFDSSFPRPGLLLPINSSAARSKHVIARAGPRGGS
eukprot:SAG31_NODE_3440_length_4267_cov_15.646353_2_plen_108_part_00